MSWFLIISLQIFIVIKCNMWGIVYCQMWQSSCKILNIVLWDSKSWEKRSFLNWIDQCKDCWIIVFRNLTYCRFLHVYIVSHTLVYGYPYLFQCSICYCSLVDCMPIQVMKSGLFLFIFKETHLDQYWTAGRCLIVTTKQYILVLERRHLLLY